MSSNRFRRIKRLGAALTAGALGVGFLPIAALTGTASASAPTPTAQSTAAFCANAPTANPFTDLPAADVHFANVLCMVGGGITHGTTPTTYSPATPVRRDQMASFIARFLDLAKSLETTAGSLTALPASGPDAFADDNGDAHETNINRLAAAGIVGGLSDPQCLAMTPPVAPPCYGPAEPVTRAQMASFINRAIGFLTGTPFSSSTDFFDDDNGNVHEDNINGLAGAGVVQGPGGGLYNPDGDVPRDQMGSFIIRGAAKLNALGKIKILPPPAGTADISVTPSPAPAILFASANAADPAGKRHFDVHVNTSTITGPVDVFLAPSTAPNIDLTTFAARWEDDNNDLRADQVNPVISNALQAKIVAINGVNPVGGATGYVDNQALPASGDFTVDIQLVGPINLNQGAPAVFLGVMRDANGDNRLSVAADKTPTEPVAIGGFTAWTSLVPANVTGLTRPVIFGGFPFTLFNLLTVDVNTSDAAFPQNPRFPYDGNDIFKINNVIVTMDQFNKALNPFDTILINFNNDPAGVSEFNITNDIGQAAPADLAIQVLNLDAGSTANDVRGTFTTAVSNQSGVVYHVQRASTAGTDGLCGTPDDGLPSLTFADTQTIKLNTIIGQDPGDQLTFTDSNVANGCYEYRIQVIDTATSNVRNSNVVGTLAAPVLVPAPNDVTAPRIMTGAGKDIGNPGTVDTGDKVALLFDEQMNLATGDILRFKDFAGEFRNVILGTGNTFVVTTRGGQTALVITFTAALTAEGDADGNAANNDGLIEWNGLTIDATTGVTDLASNEVALGTSDVAINIDTTAPAINSADGTVGFNQIIVVFNEAFDPTTAADSSKYQVNNGGGVTNDPVTNALPSTSAAPSGIAGTNGEFIAKAWVQVTLNVQFPLQSGSTMTHAVADLLGNAGNITGTPTAINTNTGILATCSGTCHTSENGTSVTIAYTLAQQPTSNVTLTVTSGNTAEGTVSGSPLVFTPANFATPQSVTVTGVNDNVADGNVPFTVTATASSADANFNGGTKATTVTNDDNDTAAIVRNPTSVTVTEAAGPNHTATFGVSLATQPSSTVNMSVSPSNSSLATSSPSSLTFTAANFATPQNVTVTGVDNAISGANPPSSINLTVLSGSAPEYVAVGSASEPVTLTDDETLGPPGMTLSGGDSIINVGTKTVTAVYNEAMNCNGGNTIAAGRYTYTNAASTGQAGGPFTGSNIANGPGPNSCVITFNSAVNFTAGDAGTLTYTRGGGGACGANQVCDIDPGSPAEALTETAQSSIAGSPDITSVVATAGGNTITLTYDEPVLCSTVDNSVPITDDYTVQVNGTGKAITSATCLGTNDNTIVLVLNTPLVLADSVQVTQIANSTSDNRGNLTPAQNPGAVVTGP
jgi:hypothetical protein